MILWLIPEPHATAVPIYRVADEQTNLNLLQQLRQTSGDPATTKRTAVYTVYLSYTVPMAGGNFETCV